MKNYFVLITFCFIFGINQISISNESSRFLVESVIPNEQAAIEIATAIFKIHYGKDLKSKIPLKAKLIQNKYWLVEGSLPNGYDGGVPYIKISKKDCKVIEIYHSK